MSEEGGLEFRLPRGHPATVKVATVSVVCPRHEDEVVVEHNLMADGTAVLSNLRGFRSEYISATRVPLPPDTLFPGFSLPSAAVEDTDNPDDVDHFRYHYECPKPTCGYDAQVRTEGEEGVWARMDAVLEGMRSLGKSHMTVTNIDGKPWRVVSPHG